MVTSKYRQEDRFLTQAGRSAACSNISWCKMIVNLPSSHHFLLCEYTRNDKQITWMHMQSSADTHDYSSQSSSLQSEGRTLWHKIPPHLDTTQHKYSTRWESLWETMPTTWLSRVSTTKVASAFANPVNARLKVNEEYMSWFVLRKSISTPADHVTVFLNSLCNPLLKFCQGFLSIK